jgi:hypothetical protein
MNNSNIVLATRLFANTVEAAPATLKRAEQWVAAAQKLKFPHFVAVNSAEDKSGLLKYLGKEVGVDVPKWGFSNPLNMLVDKATGLSTYNPEQSIVVITSAEFPVTERMLNAMTRGIQSGRYNVVGLATSEHKFEIGAPGTHTPLGILFQSGPDGFKIEQASPIQAPWNTAAAWMTRLIKKVGFPEVADKRGMEDYPALSLVQRESGQPSQLVKLPGFGEWNTTGWDAARFEAHRAKVASKILRGMQNLSELDLEQPTVFHKIFNE